MPIATGTPRITAVDIKAYIRKLTEPIMTNARLLGVLEAKKRITYNHDSSDIRWRVRFYRNRPTANDGYPVNVEFNMPNRIATAILPWRSYVMGEAITKLEKLVGRTRETAFPQLLENLVKWAMEDFQYFFQQALYADGDSGTNDLHGLESMFAHSGLISGGKVGNPNDNYAGISTALGALGGTWTGVWPEGNGTPDYCAWSPIIVDYDNPALTPQGVSTPTWATNWRMATRYGRSWLNARQGIDPDVFIMHPDLERQAKDAMDPYSRLEVTVKSPIVDLGIKTLQFEGVELVADPFCPANTAYLLTTSKMELMSMQGQLIDLHEDTDPYATDTFLFDFYGNLRFESPAFFVKFTAVS